VRGLNYDLGGLDTEERGLKTQVGRLSPPPPHFNHCTTVIRNHRQAIDRQAIAVQLTTPLLSTHCSYINRKIVSQASRGFVSESWPFLLKLLSISCEIL